MSAEKLSLRGYRRSDLDTLFALDLICFDTTFRFSRSAMRRFSEAPNAHVVVGELDGVVAGFCIVHTQRSKEEKIGYVVTLDVSPSLRRRGVAHAILHDAEKQLQGAGCDAVMLHVSTGNTAAIRFYEVKGYKLVRSQNDFYGDALDAHLYRKELSVCTSRK